MRRFLVLTNEAAGHPFRRSLPPGTLVIAPQTIRSTLSLLLRTYVGGFTAMFVFLS